jgi:hypothetical protein
VTENLITREYDERYADLSVIKNDGTVLCVFDHFLLTSANETDQEKMATVFDFSEPAIFGGLGRRPRVYGYGGILADTLSDGAIISLWKALYDKFFRGTVCARLGAYTRLNYRDQWRKGYLTGMRLSSAADRQQLANLSLTMFIIDEGSTVS